MPEINKRLGEEQVKLEEIYGLVRMRSKNHSDWRFERRTDIGSNSCLYLNLFTKPL